MKVNQNELRQRLIKYLAESGVKQSFISKQIGLNPNSLAVFKCGAYDLSEDRAEMLCRIIGNE